jgi:8-oxo-dGTP pyrophosphatase MutT (NUDIX family)
MMDEPLPVSSESHGERRGVVAVVVREGRLLVIRRSQSVAAPGAYCFPGGGIETGETVEEALRREMREELGVECTLRQTLWENRTTRGVHLTWCEVDLDVDHVITPNPAEVAGFAWHSPQAIRGLRGLLASNIEFLEALARGEFILAGLERGPSE